MNHSGTLLALVWKSRGEREPGDKRAATFFEKEKLAVAPLGGSDAVLARSEFSTGEKWYRRAELSRLSEVEAETFSNLLLERVEEAAPVEAARRGPLRNELKRVLYTHLMSTDGRPTLGLKQQLLAAAKPHLRDLSLARFEATLTKGMESASSQPTAGGIASATPASRLHHLSGVTLPEVREAFNAAASGPRALVFLSAGCASCIPAASALQSIVQKQQGALAVFVVWDDVLSVHGKPPPEKVVGLLTDPRIHQLWDPEHFMSDEMKRVVDGRGNATPQARLRTGESETGILYDTVVLFPAGVRWMEKLPTPVFLDNGFERVKEEFQKRLSALLSNRR
ncbi:MAG: hypothetical protein ACT4TC_03880 [Myxococcaceae bacterium]